jgi:hypothetical protein
MNHYYLSLRHFSPELVAEACASHRHWLGIKKMGRAGGGKETHRRDLRFWRQLKWRWLSTGMFPCAVWDNSTQPPVRVRNTKTRIMVCNGHHRAVLTGTEIDWRPFKMKWKEWTQIRDSSRYTFSVSGYSKQWQQFVSLLPWASFSFLVFHILQWFYVPFCFTKISSSFRVAERYLHFSHIIITTTTIIIIFILIFLILLLFL